MKFYEKLIGSTPCFIRITTCLAVIVSLCFFVTTVHAGTTVYRVEIPITDMEIPREELKKRFSDYAEAYIIDDAEGRRILLGGFPRRQEAEALRKIINDGHPLAQVTAMDDTSPLSRIPQQLIFTLQDIGYDEDIIAYGENPYVSLDFPWEPSSSLDGAVLFLSVRLSPHLRLYSSLTVRVEGAIVQSVALSPGQEIARLEIPLETTAATSAKVGPENSLTVVVEGNLRIYEDHCENDNSPNNWLILEKKSHLAVKRRNPPPAINSFLSGAYKELLIVAAVEELALSKAALQVAAAVKAISPHVDVRHSAAPAVSTTGRTVVVDSFPNDIKMHGPTLYVNPAGAAMFQNKAHNLLATNKAQITLNEPNDKTKQKPSLPFTALDWQTTTATGIGELVMRIPFTLRQIGGFPHSLSAILNFSTTPIPEQDLGQVKVRLNGMLAGSINLPHEQKTNRRTFTLSLPVEELSQRNQLDIVFVYYMEQGECRSSYRQMEATLFDNSFLEVGPPDNDRLLELNWVFGQMGGSGALVTPELNKVTFTALAEWVALYGEINGTIPQFDMFNDLPQSGQSDYLVLSLGDAEIPDELSFLVDTSKDLLVKNPLTGEVPFQASLGSSVWVLQTFRHQKAPVLLISALPPASRDGPHLSMKTIERFGGNVAAGSDGVWRSMDIGRQLKVVTPDEHGVHYYWNRYKSLIVIVLAGLVLLFFAYVYRNLTQTK